MVQFRHVPVFVIRGTWLHTKATVTLNFGVLEGPAVLLDQLKSLLNVYTTQRPRIRYLEVHSFGANASIGHLNAHDFQLEE